MNRLENARKAVLKDSYAYYAHLGYYHDLFSERNPLAVETTKCELDFLEFAFHVHATHKVRDVLDIARGTGRHVLGLARRGYQCVGHDYTSAR